MNYTLKMSNKNQVIPPAPWRAPSSPIIPCHPALISHSQVPHILLALSVPHTCLWLYMLLLPLSDTFLLFPSSLVTYSTHLLIKHICIHQSLARLSRPHLSIPAFYPLLQSLKKGPDLKRHLSVPSTDAA